MKTISSLIDYCEKHPVSVLTLIVITGAVLRSYHLGYKALWFDEARLYWIAQGSIHEVLENNAKSNSAPPLYAIMVNALSYFVRSDAGVRLFSWIAGILSIPVIYCLSRRYVSRFAAYSTAFLVAIAPKQVAYSQELREYSWVFLCAALLFLCSDLLLTRSEWRRWLWLTAVLVLCVFMQYGLSVLIFSINICVLILLILKKEFRNRKFIFLWFIAQLAAAGAVTSVYFLSLKYHMGVGGARDIGAASYLGDSYFQGSFHSLLTIVVKKTRALVNFAFPQENIILLLLGIGLIYGLRTNRGNRALVFLLVPILVTMGLAFMKLFPYSGHRQVMFLVPMIFVTVGIGIDYLSNTDKRKISIAIILILLSIGGLISSAQYLKSKGREYIKPALSVIRESLSERDLIYVYWGAMPAFKFYWPGSTERVICSVFGYKEQEYFVQLDDVVHLLRLKDKARLWVLFSHSVLGMREPIIEYLSMLGKVRLVVEDKGVWLYEFIEL